MWYVLISADATLLAIYTSRTDAVLAAKQHVGCAIWQGRPNAAGGELVATCKATVH